MITDAYNLIADQLATIRAAGTYTSNNTIDLSLARDVGAGEDLKVVFNVDVAFSGGTNVTPQIITSAASNLGSPTVRSQGPTLATATLVAGFVFAMDLPELAPGDTGQRYLGVQFVSTGTYTTGTISARIVKDAPNMKYYASGFSIL